MSQIARTMVAITTEESETGVPFWGQNQIVTEVPAGETEVAFENLIAGRRYYVRTWTEDMFGNKSPDLVRVINTPPDTTIPSVPTGLALTPGDNGFQASWSAVSDTDLAEYDFAYADDDGSGTGPGSNPYTVVSTRATQLWVDQTHGQKTWAMVRARDYSDNVSDYCASVATTPIRTVPLSVSANGYFDSGSPMRAFVKVPSDVTLVSSAQITLALRQFMAPATAATSGGGSTSGSSSAASSNNTSVSLGLGTNFTSGVSGGASAGTAHTHTAGSYGDASAVQTIAAHNHGIPHTHSTPNHTHSLTYGTFEESYPASTSIKVKVYERSGSSWTLLHTTASLTSDLEDVDLVAYIDGPGDYRIEVLSDGGTPNGGRLGCDLFGTIEVVI